MIKMNKEEIKILSYLSDNLGNGGNILEMLKGIKKKYGTTYYPNIYNTTKKLEKKGIIKINTEGKNRLIALEIKNPLSIYYISEVENYKATQIKIPKELLSDILYLPEKFGIFSICTLETEKYLKLNRIEMLFLIKGHDEDVKLIKLLSELESNYNIKIDPIILTLDEFLKIMKSDELSPLKDLILNKIILYNSNGFWTLISHYNIDSKYKKLGKYPQDITRKELAYNYSRFGYKLNEQIEPSDKISIETIIFSMSISDEKRLEYGAIVLLKKNIEKINWAYLFYMYKRYDELGKLKSILLSLKSIEKLKANHSIELYINLINEEPNKLYDIKMIKKYIELYD